MRLTAKDVSDRTGMSYVVASGLLTYLKNAGSATVIEKRIVGKGRPTLVYELDQHTIIDFGSSKIETSMVEAVESKVDVSVPILEVEDKPGDLTHVAAALARLREAQSAS